MKIELSDNLKEDIKFFGYILALVLISTLITIEEMGFVAKSCIMNNDAYYSIMILVFFLNIFLLLKLGELLSYLKNNIKVQR